MSTTQRAGRAAPDYEATITDTIDKGIAAIRGAKSGVDDAVADVSEKGREALDSARDLRDSVADTILDSIRTRPYTTLAIAGLIGFAYGALRRR